MNIKSNEAILFVGEGNFSFAVKFCATNGNLAFKNTVISSFESEATVYEKYGSEAVKNVQYLLQIGILC